MRNIRFRFRQILPPKKRSRPVPFPGLMACAELVEVYGSVFAVESVGTVGTTVVSKARGNGYTSTREDERAAYILVTVWARSSE
ncbi:unnamed protein product [Periconia digitata]|uniref:Uncharacterized protein n=1 Tax=Periconia digitata TaxID=1303443 RepID=A0A9W4UJ99_9PLEO|nr:unnamed protein product [Periconia digitata]